VTVAVLAIAGAARGAVVAAPAVAQEAPSPQSPPVQAEPVEPAEPAAPAEPIRQAEPEEAPPRQGQLPPRTGRPGRTPRERPPARRPSSRLPGLFEGNRISRQNDPTRKELTLTANVLGGYDDNLTAGFGTGAGSVPETAASGSAQYADASLTFYRGNAARSILLGANGNLRMYPNYIERPAPGGAAVIEATTLLGQKQTLTVGERIGYEPMFNASSRVATVPTPGIDAIPVAGLFLRQSFNSTSLAAIDHRLTRRDTTRLAYSYAAQQFEGSYGDNTAHNLSAEYRRRLSRGLSLRAGYGYLDGEYTDYADATRPNLQHTMEGGPEIETALSRRKRLALSFGGGAAYVKAISSIGGPYQFWTPIASANATLDLTPAWNLVGGYRRSFSVLQGITSDLYTTDSAEATVGGLVTARTDLRFGGSFANGITSLASGVDQDFRVYGVSAQVRFALTQTMATTVAYFHYKHRYSNPGSLPAGFPTQFDRNAVRVGLTLWVPLAGTSSQSPLTPR
jgi:hypothetical protein